ncbi:MAG TPA: phospholipase A [Steroidobacteraceae bacterium]|nr:phospholipase A [Steroidobacteraceae bacterium]
MWLLQSVPAFASETDACYSAAVHAGPPDMTVAEIRRRCEQQTVDESIEGTAIQRRLFAEFQTMDRPFTLTTHRPNYLLPVTYVTDPNDAPFQFAAAGARLDNLETKFQISFKVPLLRDVFGAGNTVFGAYTNQSWWQAYNSQSSSAFRETNHEPEVFLRHYGGPRLFGFDIAAWDVGFVHQSNGRPEPLSRSWNRVFAGAAGELGNLALSLKGWYRLPDSDDDNPGMQRYLGYGELRAFYTPNRNTFGLMLRPGSRKTSLELSWSFPLTTQLRFYALYFNGYGESLLDYDRHLERVGIGIALNDYLQN